MLLKIVYILKFITIIIVNYKKIVIINNNNNNNIENFVYIFYKVFRNKHNFELNTEQNI